MFFATAPVLAAAVARVDYRLEIQPIMADTCFRCHGFDEQARKAKLRLDIRPEALKPAQSGTVPIVPGRPGESEIIRRIFAADDDRMPPDSLHTPLTPAQKELFRRWVAEGAEYRDHWAFVPPRAATPPSVKSSHWPRNEIDRHILVQLETRQLKPAREADRPTLIRRVSLDLTGLPPTPAEVEAFLADRSPQAYEKLVDRLLASPRFGERMAQDWLDAARFADSNGYQVDRDREMWPWREWVIKAFNRNLPFDQFTIHQLAGDLLPEPTLEQKIATGFHRNHMINEEGGIIPEEFLAEYCADRVETTSTVWLGLTMGCARCHDHKYDPLTQKDYYSLFAFFHNIAEKGVGSYGEPIRRNTPPFQQLPTPEQVARLEGLKGELAATQARSRLAVQTALANSPDWESRAKAAAPAWLVSEIVAATAGTNKLTIAAGGQSVGAPLSRPDQARKVALSARIRTPRVTAMQLEFLAPFDSETNAVTKLSVRTVRLRRAESAEAEPPTLELRAAELAGTVPVSELANALDKKDGTIWSVQLAPERSVTGVFALAEPVVVSNELVLELELELGGERLPPAWQARVRTTDLATDLIVPPDVLRIIAKPPTERTAKEVRSVEDFRARQLPESTAHTRRIAELMNQIDEADLAIPITLVMEEMAEPRPTFVLLRGAYDRKGEPVTARTPSSLPAFLPNQPANRLGLARWLVSPQNPLTARVTVNRLWQSVFGTGLVRTAEDFGTRGEPPTHFELLDWLALEFVRSGWDVKYMMRLLVTSATYRQDSRSTPSLHTRDPENRLLARGPRHRLSAEMIRDQALAVSGLLVERVGGPSVKPYHPPGLYEQVVAGTGPSTYVQGHGEDLYRRSLYTYWKRSVPNPAMLVFDAPFRETCVVRRSCTTTPLQALNLLNDPTFVEAARGLAQRMMREGGDKPATRIQFGFRIVTGRSPTTRELAVLMKRWQQMRTDFHADHTAAEALIGVGESKRDARLSPVELAAYTTTASTLLNLDETITNE